MIGRIFVAILALVVLFGFGSVITGGVHNLRTEEITQTASVTTEAGETTADVVLNSALFRDLIGEVESITSTIEETPAVDSYAAETKTLTISGLTASESRTLTIVYNMELDDEFMGIIGPFLLFIIFGGIIFALIWGVVKGRR